jgi:hypothetical protein
MPIFTSQVSASAAVTSSIVKAYTSVMPDTNDGASIGAAGTAFSDMFLAEGGVINWDSGDLTLTQTGNSLAVAGGTLAATLSTAAQTNITSLGTLIDLEFADGQGCAITTDGFGDGTINGFTIGGSEARPGTFTTLASTGNTTIGNASGDELTINPSSIIASNMPTGTGNSVVIKNAIQGFLSTDEIDPRVWGTTLLDGSNGTNNELAIFTDSNTVEGDSKVTWDGATFAIDGDLRAINYIVSSSVTHMTQSFSSGSTIFGDTIDDRHEFTGSLYISGSATFRQALTNLTLVTPALGTPSALVLTNATALPAAQVAQGTMASGMVLVAPALGTPASGVLTNCTALPAAQVAQGTMASGMVLVAPVLGTPASGVLTNCTALPAAQVAQGTMASGMVLVAPALGTPASGVATNLTGTAAGLTAGAVSTIAGLAPNTATTQATQGAITSLGTLTGLTLNDGSATDVISIDGSGGGALNNLTIGATTAAYGKFTTLIATGNATITGNVSGSSTSTGSFGRVEAAKISGTLTTAAQTNVTSLGTLAGLTVNDGGSSTSQFNVDGSGGGAINGVTIGATVATTGEFTTVTTSGNVTGSSVSTGSFGHVVATTFKGDGSAITGLSAAAISSVAGMTNNYVLTATGAAAVTGESALTFDGATGILTVTGTIAGTAVKDEDNMASNSATHLASQQSIKAYVDSSVTAQDLDATTDSGTIDIDLDSEALTIAGGSGIDTSATGTTITIAGEDSTAANKGVVIVAGGTNATVGYSSGTATVNVADAFIKNNANDTSTGTITAAGFVSTEGNISGSSSSTGSFGYLYTAGGGMSAGTILPSADNSYDLGSAAYRFANLYVGDLMMSNKSRGGNEVDGTYGDYTIQEGEEDLYLLNHRNGKTYRFKLEEVDSRPWYKKIFS